MLRALLTSSCNLTEGVADLYDVLLASYARHRHHEPDQQMVRDIMIEVGQTIYKRPQLKQLVAMMATGVIAMDAFMDGEDYNVAMNRSRNLCLKALNSPLFMLEVYKFYYRNEDAMKAWFERLEDKLDDANDDLEGFQVVILAVYDLIAILRPAIAAVAA